ncbi:MAG: PilZ domain-containing protein [Alphaproteobacteria bacterium]|nr:PilZ domain-containing protein [Alphaproteobacteria bacterium]
MAEKMDQYTGERRISHRLKVQIPVDVFYGARRHTLGEVVNLSRDGAAVDTLLPLTVGQLYRFHLHEFGAWAGIVIRRFGATRHGIRFDADERQKCRIDEVIRTILSNTKIDNGQSSMFTH